MAGAKKTVGQVILNEVRLSFPDLFEKAKPSVNKKTGEVIAGKFKANFLMVKGSPSTKENQAKIKAAMIEAKTSKWGPESKWPKIKPERLCLRDGDLEDYDGYENSLYLAANNDDMPVLVDRQKDAEGKWLVLTKENGGAKKLYGGAFVRAIVRIWAQDHPEYGKRMNASLESVQFLRHGEAFGNRAPVDPNDAFDDLPDEDDEDFQPDGDDLV